MQEKLNALQAQIDKLEATRAKSAEKATEKTAVEVAAEIDKLTKAKTTEAVRKFAQNKSLQK